MNKFTAAAPARANLIGEHTDYATNRGHVLPTPLPFHTTVCVTEMAGAAGQASISSEHYANQSYERNASDKPRGHWTDYVVGCLQAMLKKTKLPALEIKIKSDVPVGCGISSSAALCVAVVRALKGLTGAVLDDEQIALMAHEAEHDFVGVPCGMMDQFVSSIGRPGQALLLNTKTLAYRHYPLPADTAIMLVNCGKKHDLANGSGYKQRVAECTEARDRLGVGTLCELGYKDLDRLSALPEIIRRRARHVITENLRVLEFVSALEKGDTEKQADLLAASHVSQRDDFEVSIPEIDALVESSKRFGIRGARIVGGGFGGSIIALVPREKAVPWWSFVARENPNSQLISTYALKNNENEYAA
ncbi:MAG: galactokinase [Rhizomicrobium sp.]